MVATFKVLQPFIRDSQARRMRPLLSLAMSSLLAAVWRQDICAAQRAKVHPQSLLTAYRRCCA
jgi:hypothetical protein